MTRWWTERVADLSDLISLPLLVLLLAVVAAGIGALWFWYPAWLPRHWPHLAAPQWRPGRPRRPGWPDWLRWSFWRSLLRRRSRDRADPAAEVPATAPPPIPVDATLADRLAAEGRYAEAVRERLRTAVRHLTDRGVVEQRPGWTVTELTGAAGTALPAVSAPLTAAGEVFAEIWYAQRPADAATDARMRAHTAEIDRALDGSPS